MQRNKSVFLYTGQQDELMRDRTIALSKLLESNGIAHHIDLWGHDVGDQWDSRGKMLIRAIADVSQSVTIEELRMPIGDSL